MKHKMIRVDYSDKYYKGYIYRGYNLYKDDTYQHWERWTVAGKLILEIFAPTLKLLKMRLDVYIDSK